MAGAAPFTGSFGAPVFNTAFMLSEDERESGIPPHDNDLGILLTASIKAPRVTTEMMKNVTHRPNRGELVAGDGMLAVALATMRGRLSSPLHL